MMAVRKGWTMVRDSLWFVPAIWVVASAGLAFALIAVDAATPDFARRYPLVFGGGADGARGLLSAIAGSMITVVGVTFSMTIVALQLASSQFSPRVLRTFLKDRASQMVLGSFIGAFTYAILVLRSIRAEEEGFVAFVPSLAVSGGIAFSLVALGMLVYFIHHTATRIQISTLVANIADETSSQVAASWPDGPEPSPPSPPGNRPGTVNADDSGYLQFLDTDALARHATEDGLVIRMEVRPGDWVQRDAPLFSVWPASGASDEIARKLLRQVSVGNARSIEQDASFGIRQLVDVGVKAISAGINDPTSATDCIDRLGQILVAAGLRHPPHRARCDDEGEVRLIVPYRGWDEFVNLAFDQLRQYSRGNADISLAMLRGLATTAKAVPSERHAALHRQARLIGDAAEAIPDAHDRQRVLDAVELAVRA